MTGDDGWWESVMNDSPSETDEGDAQVHIPEAPENVVSIPTEYNAIRGGVEPVMPELADPFGGLRVRPVDPNAPAPPPPTIMPIHYGAGPDKYERAGSLLAPGHRYILTGHFESAKSMLALAAAATVMMDHGGTVLWYDSDDMGEEDSVVRLRDVMNVPDQIIREKFMWSPAEIDTDDRAALSAFMALEADAHKPSLVVWDTLGPAMARLGLDEMVNSDVNIFMDTLVGPVRDACPDVMMVFIDHPAKNADGPRRTALGAQRKMSVQDQGLEMSRDPEKDGTFYVKVTKDRKRLWKDWRNDGLTFTLEDGGGWYLSRNATPVQKKQQAESSMKVGLQVCLHRAGRTLSAREWIGAYRDAGNKGDDKQIRDAIKELVDAGCAAIVDRRNNGSIYEWRRAWDDGADGTQNPAPGPLTSDPEIPW